MKTNRWNRLFEIAVIASVIFACFSGCAGLSGGTPELRTFDQLTSDEQNRVVFGAIQFGEDPLFAIGQGVMIVKPEYNLAWKSAVVPGFDQLNLLLKDIELKGDAGQAIDVQAVLQSLQGRVASILSIISAYGTIPAPPSSKPTAENYGNVVILGLSTASIVWNDVVAAINGVIPTWKEILARNAAMQAKIDAEK